MRHLTRAVLPLVAAAVVVAVVLGATATTDPPTPSQDEIPGVAAPEETVPPSPPPTPESEPQHGMLAVWSRGDLTPAMADTAEGLPGVLGASFVRSDTLGLTAVRAADGSPRVQLEAGYRIPVEVAAVDPEDMTRTFGAGEVDSVVTELRPGAALVTATSAGLRGMAVGDRLDLVSLPGLRVAAIVPDGTLRNAEIVLHAADADAAGLDPDGSLLVRHSTAGAARAQLEAALRALAPDDAPTRVVAFDGARRYRAPLVLSMSELKDRFGEFAFRPRAGVREIDVDPAFVAEHIVSADVPILGTVRCHEGIVEDLRGALTEIVEAGNASAIDPTRYAGCFHPRLISVDRDRLSRHSWGIAIDINVDLSKPGLGAPPPASVIAAFERHGFRWGGDFLHPDNHHFEWVGPDVV